MNFAYLHSTLVSLILKDLEDIKKAEKYLHSTLVSLIPKLIEFINNIGSIFTFHFG